MRVCFIHSSYYPVKGELSKGTKAWIHGVTLPLLAGCVDSSHSVSIINDSVHSLPNKNDYDVFFISMMGSAIERVKEIAALLKTDTNYIIVGGKPFNETADLIEDFVDSVVLGEAETLIPGIIKDIETNNVQKHYGSRDLRTDIEHLPVPRYDLIDRKKHSNIYPIEATRGCPNDCTFCYIAAWSKKQFRKRPISEVIRDITVLKKMGINKLLFVDDCLFSDRNYALALFGEMKKLKMHWVCQITAQAIIDQELITAAAACGLFAVTIGFESMSHKNLASVKKRNDPDLYARGIAILHSLNILTFPMFVIGFEDKIQIELAHITEFCLNHKVTAPLLYILTPAIGTPLYDEYLSSGKLEDDDLAHYNLFHVVFKHDDMTKDELANAFWTTYRNLYSFKNIFKRVLCKKMSIKSRIISLGINLLLQRNTQEQRQLQLK